jgi:hypothetical protein
MKVRDKIILGCLIILLMLLHRYLFPESEGFVVSNPDYDRLKTRLATDLGPYCKIATFVREQLKTMTAATGGAADEASLNQTYTAMYSCTDELASSRPSCPSLGPLAAGAKGMFGGIKLPAGLGGNPNLSYVSCDTYMNLPPWSNDGSASLALMKITSDLPERIVREGEWFASIIKKVQEGLDLGANPPGVSPVGTPSSIDGFQGTCSVDAARIKLAQQAQTQANASSCTIPNVNSEIVRINALLDSSKLKEALSKMNGMLTSMLKLQSDLEKAKNGTLYEWQKSGPQKSFPKFQGGDRLKSLLFSMQQNN